MLGASGGGVGGAADTLVKLLGLLTDPAATKAKIAELREIERREAAVAARERAVGEREKVLAEREAAIPAEVERRVEERWAPVEAVIAEAAEA
jgi:hypothetical protein